MHSLSAIRRTFLPLLTVSFAACSEIPLSPSDGSGGTTIVDIELPAGGAGFSVTGVRDGYSDRPADEATLTATWIARLPG